LFTVLLLCRCKLFFQSKSERPRRDKSHERDRSSREKDKRRRFDNDAHITSRRDEATPSKSKDSGKLSLSDERKDSDTLTGTNVILSAYSTEHWAEEREAQKDSEEAQLEEEIRKRKERVKAWQEAKAKKSHDGNVPAPLSEVPAPSVQEKEADFTNEDSCENIKDLTSDNIIQLDEGDNSSNKFWSLEDDEDEEIVGIPTEGDSSVKATDEPPSSATMAPFEQPDKHGLVKTEAEDFGFDSGIIKSSRRKKLRFSTESPNVKTFHDSPMIDPSKKSNMHVPVRSVLSEPIISSYQMKSVSEAKMDESEDDPLDAFMSSLYGTGEVETQKELQSTVIKGSGLKGYSKLPHSSGSNDMLSEDEDEFSFYTGTGKVNPFGTNFITLDQLLSKEHSSQERDIVAGWDSVVGGSSPVDQFGLDAMNNDETEERERKEFMEAIRKAQEDEEISDNMKAEKLERSLVVSGEEKDKQATIEGMITIFEYMCTCV